LAQFSKARLNVLPVSRSTLDVTAFTAPAANLHYDAFGDSGAAQVAGGSAAQIMEEQAGNAEWGQNHQSSPTQD
jgi:hypothetical protein